MRDERRRHFPDDVVQRVVTLCDAVNYEVVQLVVFDCTEQASIADMQGENGSIDRSDLDKNG
jgi:hypothetical protein